MHTAPELNGLRPGLGIGVLPPSLGMSWIDQRYLPSSAIVFRSFIRARFPEREGVSSA